MPLAMQQLIAAAVTLFATAPPALLSLPRTSAAVPELLFDILLLHAAFQRRLRTDASAHSLGN
jgi:hypothetical protein